MSDHSTLTGANLHHPWHYIQDADPGAVGAGLWWYDSDGFTIYRRNDTNTAWIPIVASSWEAPSIEILIPAGSTTAQIQAIIDGAAAGSTIILANEVHVQTATLRIEKSITIKGHPGGLSSFKLLDNVSTDEGGGSTAHQIMIGDNPGTVAVDGVRLTGFKIEHDRVTSPNMRTLAIDIMFTASNVEIDHIEFVDITSDCLIIRPYPFTYPGALNVSLHDCTATEWWEGFFNFHAGFLTNCWVYNNTATASNQHAGYQGPMGLEINIEQELGEAVGVYMSNNSFALTGAAIRGSGTNGFVENANIPTGNCRYDKIYVQNNLFSRFLYGMYLPAPNTTFGAVGSLETLLVVSDNTIVDCGTPVYIWPDSNEGAGTPWRTGSPNDRMVFIRNTNDTNVLVADQSRLTAGNIQLSYIDNTGLGV